jgi:hypothetical protein
MSMRTDIDEVMDRTTRFCANGRTGDALVMVRGNFSHNRYDVRGLDEWRFPEQMEAFLDEKIKALRAAWQGRDRIADDLIPALFPHYGIAEHSAFAARNVKVDFGANTSWPHAVIRDYGDLDALELREDNPWLRMVIDGLAYLRDRSEGEFALKLRGVMAPMDLANALRGNDIFYDIYEHPEALRKLLAYCVEAGEWFVSRQKQVAGDFHGGTLCGTDIWMPGNAIGHLSEDASVLCSPETYREFGLPYTEALVQPYDAAFMHLHTAGAHAFEAITSIGKLQFFELAPDPNQPRPIEVYRNNMHLFQGKFMRLFTTLDEIKGNLSFLKQAKTALVCNARSVEEAETLVAFVRKELPIL